MKKLASLFLALAMLLSLAACGASDDTSTPSAVEDTFTPPADYASVILVTINPQFKLYLDTAGSVLAVEPVNDDAKSIVAPVNTHAGDLDTVMKELVTAVNDGGFVKDQKATVTIQVAEVAEDAAVPDTKVLLQQVETATDTAFEALKIEADITTATMAPPLTTTTDGTTTTTEGTTTTTTTTAKPTTTTTTKKPTTTTTKKPTTTTKALTAIAQKAGSWSALYPVGECLYSAGLVLVGEKNVGCGIGDPLSGFSPEEQELMKPDCTLYKGEYYYFGRGDGDEIAAVKESGNTVTLTDSSGNKLVLTRTGEDTLKVTSGTVFGPLESIPAGLVFTFTKE